jgi:photosystem II stability/assembly factor-like uncharacterized protein
MKRFWLVFSLLSAAGFAASVDSKMFADLRWRSIGPLRGGRTKSAQGVPAQPNVFYIGVCNGGVWKSTDYGRTWKPIFDDQPTGSIGAIAVAPSDPNIIYVGSGEGLQRPDLSTGDGIYKSTDAGKTWTHLGLRDGQQIPQIAVDPHNPNRLFVAVLGHPYGPNAERGIYRSTDGGQTFEKVLSKDENTGGSEVVIDPSNSDVVYAGLWEARQGPWENAAWSGTNGGIFKSTDGGSHWTQLKEGLPQVIQANLAIAPSNPRRIYASIASPGNGPGGGGGGRGAGGSTGIYRSDDAGATWTRITADPRPAARIGGGDLSVPVVDPKNADVVYVTSTVTWKSTDGGKTWSGLRGAPGGDDYQRMWINPNNPDVILLVSDQGAVVSVNGGQSWSSWYNQSTAQVYHVNTDNDFPYRVCSGQQESGSACVSSRGNDGVITMREWHPVGVEEYGFAAPDPLNPNIVFGGKVTRFDRRTAQVSSVAPEAGRGGGAYRTLRTAPLVFSQKDPHVMYFAGNIMYKTSDGGHSWTKISPDLTRKSWDIPASVGKYRSEQSAQPAQRGVIYTIAPSPLDLNRIWAGTDDGLIHVTVDGGVHWTDVTPKEVTAWEKVSIIDASHFDPLTAYAAINTLRLDDMRPHIFRTHDGGKTWKEIVSGIPDGEPVDAVREDPKKKGLLFAGTERAVYISFDDGDNWQSLRLNMPATSVRDLAIKDDDLIAGTHGRGFWILDDITPLRQINSDIQSAAAYLFRPETAYRVRWDMNTDTPLPPDEPQAQNPPDGAILNYYLGAAASGPVTLEIHEAATGALVRKYSSTDPLPPVDPMLAVPTYWVRPPRGLSAEPGMHRFLWDMHWTPLPGGGGRGGLPMQAVFENTVPAPNSIWAAPGRYIVKLTVNGKSYTQPLTLKMDPRVKTPPAGLQQQYTLSKQVYDAAANAQKALAQLRKLREQLQQMQGQAQGTLAEAIAAFDKKAGELQGAGGGGGRGGRGAAPAGPPTLSAAAGNLTQLMQLLDEADVTPTTQLTAAVSSRLTETSKLIARWNALKGAELAALNAQLKAAGLGEIGVE